MDTGTLYFDANILPALILPANGFLFQLITQESIQESPGKMLIVMKRYLCYL